MDHNKMKYIKYATQSQSVLSLQWANMGNDPWPKLCPITFKFIFAFRVDDSGQIYKASPRMPFSKPKLLALSLKPYYIQQS